MGITRAFELFSDLTILLTFLKPKAKAVKKAVAKKPAKLSASGTVLAIIKRARKGVDTAALKKKTRLKDSNIRTILYRLSKQGKIKTEGKGLYVKA
jgi:hypothetical protein